MTPELIAKRTSTLHDFPYEGPRRKCFHPWIINIAPPGRAHCVHACSFCYARDAIYSDLGDTPRVYDNLPELVERDLKRLTLVPPVLLSTTTDPCQDVPEVKQQVRRLVGLLMEYGVAFGIITKGDPSFLGELPGFWAYEPKYLSVSIEGTAEVLQILSPHAPTHEQRIAAVRTAATNGARVAARLDPYFMHVFQGLYGEAWWPRTEGLLDEFASAGAQHVTASTGRLDNRRATGATVSMRERLLGLVRAHAGTEAAEAMARDYVYGWSGTCRGHVLREELRVELHGRLREACRARGMTYASCQELTAELSDSPGLPHCGGFVIPFSRKKTDGRFEPVPGCTANCHRACAGNATPPCGRPELAQARPYRVGRLR